MKKSAKHILNYYKIGNLISEEALNSINTDIQEALKQEIIAHKEEVESLKKKINEIDGGLLVSV